MAPTISTASKTARSAMSGENASPTCNAISASTRSALHGVVPSCVGLDFSPVAIAAARDLQKQTGLDASFVEGNVYDARELIKGHFDMVYVTWGAIGWLPDIARWAKIVSSLLKPGGTLYLLEGHPSLMTLNEKTPNLRARL